MKHLTATLLILLLLCAASARIKAQGGDSWIQVSPTGEEFTVLMPGRPTQKRQKNAYGDLSVDAIVYKAMDGDTSYAVWSLKNVNYPKGKLIDTDEYLDSCAELVWESLLRPLRDRIPQEPGYDVRMTYVTELSGRVYRGREYRIRLDTVEGITNFYAAGGSIYVLMVLNASPSAPDTLRFLRSFTPAGAAPPATMDADPSLFSTDKPPRPTDTQVDSNDPNRVFSTREVGQKARILTRPEPQYTESARKFGVTGTVVLRGVFSKEGEVTNIKVLSKLPHGLTRQAVMAAQQIRFIPAQIDGRSVSQYIQIEYNFNLY